MDTWLLQDRSRRVSAANVPSVAIARRCDCSDKRIQGISPRNPERIDSPIPKRLGSRSKQEIAKNVALELRLGVQRTQPIFHPRRLLYEKTLRLGANGIGRSHQPIAHGIQRKPLLTAGSAMRFGIGRSLDSPVRFVARSLLKLITTITRNRLTCDGSAGSTTVSCTSRSYQAASQAARGHSTLTYLRWLA